MAQDPWDNDPVIRPRDDATRVRERVTRPDGTSYYVQNRSYTNETPTQLLNQGYRQDEGGTWAKTVGQVDEAQPWNDAPVVSDEELARARVPLQSDPMSAYASSATEQLFGLDKAAAAVTGLITGRPYSEVRALQADLRGYDRENYGLARDAGGISGFGATLAAPGAAYVRGAGLADDATRVAIQTAQRGQAVRAAQIGGAYSAALAGTSGEGSFAERLPRAAQAGALGFVTGGVTQRVASGIGNRLNSIASPAPARTPVAERIADFDRVGVTPALAGVGGPNTQRVGQLLAGNAFTAGPIQRASQRAREETVGAVEDIASRYGVAEGRDAAGGVIRNATEEGAQRLRAGADPLYAPVNELQAANPTQRIPLTNAARSISESLNVFQTPELRDWFTRNASDLSQIEGVLNRAGNEVAFGEARQLRSVIGRMLDDPQVFNSQSQAGLKSLYGALSDDISEGARLLGGEEAATALSRADTYYSAAMSRANGALRRFYQSRGGREVTDAEAYNQLLSAARTKGNRSSAPLLRQVRESVTPEEWGDIGGGIIRTLGGEGDNFSVAKFASEYEALTSEARRILFGGAERAETFADLNALARVARQQTDASKFYNYSESGNTIGNFASASAVGGAALSAAQGNVAPLVGVIGAGVAGRGLAELLTQPGVARWLAGSARAAVPEAERLARRNAAFGQWWGVNREAVVRALAQNDNLSTIEIPLAAEEQ